MALSSISPTRQPAASEPAYRRLHRAFFALCIILAPLLVAGWFALCPQYGDPTCPSSVNHLSVLVAYRAANPLLLSIFLFLNLVIPYLYPLSYICLGLLSMKRAPWLSTIGIACGFIGSIPWGTIADQSFLLNAMARLGHDSLLATLENNYFSINPEAYVMAAGWVIGHLLGYVFLGIALARARVIPQWAAWLIVASAPLMGPIAYGSGLGILQVLGYVLVFIGSIPAALVMLKGSEKEIHAREPSVA